MKKAVLSIVLLLVVSLLFSTTGESQKCPPRVVSPETGITFVLILPGRFQIG